MTITETHCSECGTSPAKKSQYCGDCGAGPDPWEERAEYDFERDVELPMVFSQEKYNDDYNMWRTFCAAAFGVYYLNEEDIANLPNGMPQMKYNVFEVYYKLDENLELHGPYLSKDEARNA